MFKCRREEGGLKEGGDVLSSGGSHPAKTRGAGSEDAPTWLPRKSPWRYTKNVAAASARPLVTEWGEEAQQRKGL